ncbi:HipA family kinase [Pseudomonas sp. YH-1]|uniref:HipA family kinase n=1 Tax=Pseudomonas sp. YH-1 TaxID=3384787 RepID=UPI003F7F4364
MSQINPPLVDAEVGLYLGGDAVEDREIRGKNPLFYGLVKFSQGRRFHAYVKVLPPKQMYAEMLSSALGKYLGLPVPYTSVVAARGVDVGISADMVPCLASVDTGAMPIARMVRAEEVNDLLNKWAHRRTAIVFDELIANSDRNLRNLLMGGDGRLWLIDHEEALGDPLTAPHRTVCNHLLKRLMADVQKFERRRTGQLLSEQAIALNDCDFRAHALKSLPGNCRVDANHVESVVEFLKARIHHMPRLIGQSIDPNQEHLELGT